MKLEKYFKCYLMDGESGTPLLRDTDRAVCSFVSSCILDSNVRMLDEKFWKTEQSLNEPFKWTILTPTGWISKNASEIEPHVVEKKKRALLLADGYKQLLVTCEWLMRKYDHVSLISLDDIDLCTTDREVMIPIIADAMGVTNEQAEKHLDLALADHKSLRIHEVEIRWKYREMLRKVYTLDDLNVWKNDLRDVTVGVGQV